MSRTPRLARLVFCAALGAAMSLEAGSPAVVVMDRVNARSQPTLRSEVVAQLRQGETVLAFEEVVRPETRTTEITDWTRIALPKDRSVWVFVDYVDPATGRVLANDLRVRSGPGTRHSNLGIVNRGDLLQVRKVQGDWVEVEPPDNASVYVASALLIREESPLYPVRAETLSTFAELGQSNLLTQSPGPIRSEAGGPGSGIEPARPVIVPEPPPASSEPERLAVALQHEGSPAPTPIPTPGGGESIEDSPPPATPPHAPIARPQPPVTRLPDTDPGAETPVAEGATLGAIEGTVPEPAVQERVAPEAAGAEKPVAVAGVTPGKPVDKPAIESVAALDPADPGVASAEADGPETAMAGPPETLRPAPALADALEREGLEVVPIPDNRRIVLREGIVSGTASIQAPGRFELRSVANRVRIVYLHPVSEDVDLRPFRGRLALVTGEEFIDPRWPRTPVLFVEHITLAP